MLPWMGLKATVFLEDVLEELGRSRHGLVIKYDEVRDICQVRYLLLRMILGLWCLG